MAVDEDFAEFTTAVASTTTSVLPSVTDLAASVTAAAATALPNLKNLGPWYAIWERHSLNEFYTELAILGVVAAVVLVHVWGSRRNREIAKQWMSVHAPVLAREFALVGFPHDNRPNTIPSGAEEAPKGAVATLEGVPLIKENSPVEFISYASGRQNVAFAYITLKLLPRNNPIMLLGEKIGSFIFESIPVPQEYATITLSPFDGSEKANGDGPSKYDNFVFGIVNKRIMRKCREERYDLSLTKTNEAEPLGLPSWAVVMSESTELSKVITTPEVRDAVEQVGSNGFDYLLATDQPIDRPTRLDEAVPKKRVTLKIPITSESLAVNGKSTKLVGTFIRFVDHLVSAAHFRPEISKKIKATREEQSRKFRLQEEQEKAEERELKRAEEKKKERDAKLRGMTAEEQKKFIEKEKEKENRKMLKKMSKRA